MAFALLVSSHHRPVVSVVEITKSSVKLYIMDRWVDRVAVVTGASEGIGAAICEELVKRGMKVIGCARRVDAIQEMARKLTDANSLGSLIAYECDLSEETQIVDMYKKIRDDQNISEIHVCINNAVTMVSSSLIDGETKDWDDMLKVGVLGVCINTREAIKMMTAGCGHIIQMGGITGHKIPNLGEKPEDVPDANLNFYHGMKFMIRALTEGLRQETREKMKERNIRVSTISPGSVQTTLFSRATSDEGAAKFYRRYRCLQPKDVVDEVIHMLSAADHVDVHDIIMEPVDFQV